MTRYADNGEFLAALRRLIDGWCDRRCFKALSQVLPGFLAFNGMTDGWAELQQALVKVRGLARGELSDDEMETVTGLITATDEAIGGREILAEI